MNASDRKQIFDFSLERVKEVAAESFVDDAKAFAKWFIGLYLAPDAQIKISDGAGDGKVDTFLKVSDNDSVQHVLINSKFTTTFDKLAPPSFYDEIVRFTHAFVNKDARTAYLKTVRSAMRSYFRIFFERYDNGAAHLIFVTNHRKNTDQMNSIKNANIKILHLEDVLQAVVDNAEGAMPRTPDLKLEEIFAVLTPPKAESAVATSIVFGRIVDFIDYMRQDPLGLLFARNVRLNLGNTIVNDEIACTYEFAPNEFAYSNNGITLLCEKHEHNPGLGQVVITNPRVVNGSQTLHSIQNVMKRQTAARVMVKIVSIPALSQKEWGEKVAERKEIIKKIAMRTNRQNTIKLADLVANDDVQQEISMFFRRKGYYYERRQREWLVRKVDLQAAGIDKGPRLKNLMQICASYLWNSVGPAKARSSVQKLFGNDIYPHLTDVSPHVLYYLWLIMLSLEESAARVSMKGSAQLKSISKYANYALLSLMAKALVAARINLEKGVNATTIEQSRRGRERNWDLLVKSQLMAISRAFRAARKEDHKKGYEVTVANYFKNASHMKNLLKWKATRSDIQLINQLFS